MAVAGRNTRYTWGIKELNELLGKIKPGTLIVLMGHPGAGKTTMSTKVVFANAMKSRIKSAYIGLAETREKYIDYMEGLGFDMRKLENKGLFKYVEIPTLTGEIAYDVFVSTITKVVTEYDPDIVVVDSVTPLLWSFKSEQEKRSFLHAGIYKLVSQLKKVVILIVDLPYDKESADSGGVEFIADTVLVIKVKSERGLPTRWLEIRKSRGTSIKMMELPFVIIKGPGIKIIKPPITWKITVSKRELLFPVSDELTKLVGPIYKGAQILITYPAGTDVPVRLASFLAKRVFRYARKMMIVSNSTPPEIIRAQIISSLIPEEGSVKKIRELFRRYVKINAQDVLGLSTTEILGGAIVLVEKSKPDIIYVPDVSIQRELMKNEELFNRMNYSFALVDRAHGVVTVRALGISGSSNPILAEVSDAVIHIDQEIVNGRRRFKIKVLKSMGKYPELCVIRAIEEELSELEPDQELFAKLLAE